MSEARGWLHTVAAAFAAGADTWTENNVTVQRVTGGANNALYRVELEGACYACKLCVADERNRARREYGVMRLLHAAGLDLAPEPLHLDESGTFVPFPAVIYRWLPGVPLAPPLTARHLGALLDSFHRIHRLRAGDDDPPAQEVRIPDAWFHWFDLAPYLSEMRVLVDTYGSWLAAADPEGSRLRDRLVRLLDGCTAVVMAADVDTSRDAIPLCLCRVDPNLANTVWGGDGRLRWVDWEYSGWGDPALDVAELRWHAALAGLSETQHRWLRASYRRPAGDEAFDERLGVWDCIVATRWPLLVLRWLQSQYHGPDRVRLTQPAADPAEVRARLVHFVERAEQLVHRGGGAAP
jgi:aminoglycoside phosphotransferase (APT) family kinase protein